MSDHRHDGHERWRHDDDALLDELADLVDEVDPVPSDVVATAKAAPDLVGLDEEYLQLVATESAAGVRGGTARDVVFRSPGWSVEVSVVTAGDRRVLDGQVVVGRAAEVVHERVAGERRAEVDRFGQFLLPDVPAGLGRLVIVTGDGRRVPAAWVVW